MARFSRRALMVALMLALNVGGWWLGNRAQGPTEWHGPLECVSYFARSDHGFQDGVVAELDPHEIDAELAILEGRTRCIRTYHLRHGMEQVPAIAARHGLDVMLGIWIDKDPEDTRVQLESAIALANRYPNVKSLILGNETLQFERVSYDALVAILAEARARTDKPVSTAENWYMWLNKPELGGAVDFATLHVLPYWHQAASADSIGYVLERTRWVQERLAGVPVVVGETGWPSSGPQNGASVPSLVTQAAFVRGFAAIAQERGLHYNMLEAFDQPWKIETNEGRVGAHWGILTPEGEPKFALAGPVVENGDWRWWAGASCLAMFVLTAWFFLRERRIGWRGELLAAIVIQALVTLTTVVAVTGEREYLLDHLLMWTLVFPTVLLLGVVTMALMAETAEVVGDAPLPITDAALAPPAPARHPFVSIHLPCRNEPPEMVKQTIASLLALDWPAFEIVVIDNNSSEEATWKPVEAFAAHHPDKVRFHVLRDWPGFKAGALNYALTVTAPEAELIAVVDSDYIVEPGWLNATVPHFEDAGVAVVQCPQDHREHDGSAFERLAADEYRGFFAIGMVQRNERNAIIQHGTMTIIRRRALEEVGRWAEWCIVEDAELGLRLQERGHRLLYVPTTFGRGLVPPTFSSFCTQRQRWAYGAVRVTLAHWKTLFGIRPGLTRAQRLRYLAGWLPWFADAFHLLFSLLGLIAAVFFIVDFRSFPPPELALPFLSLSGLRWVFNTLAYRKRVPIGLGRTLMAGVVGTALTNTIGLAVWRGLFSSRLPFQRTDKTGAAAVGMRAVAKLRLDLLLALGLFAASVILVRRYGIRSLDAVVWAAVLCMQALPGLAAMALLFVSGRSRRAPAFRSRPHPQQP